MLDHERVEGLSRHSSPIAGETMLVSGQLGRRLHRWIVTYCAGVIRSACCQRLDDGDVCREPIQPCSHAVMRATLPLLVMSIASFRLPGFVPLRSCSPSLSLACG